MRRPLFCHFRWRISPSRAVHEGEKRGNSRPTGRPTQRGRNGQPIYKGKGAVDGMGGEQHRLARSWWLAEEGNQDRWKRACDVNKGEEHIGGNWSRSPKEEQSVRDGRRCLWGKSWAQGRRWRGINMRCTMPSLNQTCCVLDSIWWHMDDMCGRRTTNETWMWQTEYTYSHIMV